MSGRSTGLPSSRGDQVRRVSTLCGRCFSAGSGGDVCGRRVPVPKRLLQGVACASHAGMRGFQDSSAPGPGTLPARSPVPALFPFTLHSPLPCLLVVSSHRSQGSDYRPTIPGFGEFPASTELCSLAWDLLLSPYHRTSKVFCNVKDSVERLYLSE